MKWGEIFRDESGEQKSALQNTKMLYEPQKAVLELFNDYFSTAYEAKYKVIHGKGRSCMLVCVAETSHCSHLKILTPKYRSSCLEKFCKKRCS